MSRRKREKWSSTAPKLYTPPRHFPCPNPSLCFAPSSQENPGTLHPKPVHSYTPPISTAIRLSGDAGPLFLEPPPAAARPECAACLFSRESGTRQAHALQQQTRLNGEFARDGRREPAGVGERRRGSLGSGWEEEVRGGGSGGCSRLLQQQGVGGEAGPGLRVGLGVPLKRRPHSGRPALSHSWPGNVEGAPTGSRPGRASERRK